MYKMHCISNSLNCLYDIRNAKMECSPTEKKTKGFERQIPKNRVEKIKRIKRKGRAKKKRINSQSQIRL